MGAIVHDDDLLNELLGKGRAYGATDAVARIVCSDDDADATLAGHCPP
jgi:hypothetical protein